MTNTGTGLYVHVPFCARACPYCDFDFEVGRNPPVEAFLQGLEDERVGRGLPEGLALHTVYVGGGTPSQLGPKGVRALLRWIDERFEIGAAVERTVELNPEHVDEALLDALVESGVDRVSMGVQSLRPSALEQLGRAHAPEQAQRALLAAVARGLRVSADLIVGWPGQRAAALQDDVRALLRTGVEHVSIYALTIEADTPWEALVQRGRRRMPRADTQAMRLREAEALLQAAGLVHYEVASYARPGAEARHNLGYWTGADYVGLGPSAASAIHLDDGTVERRTNLRGLSAWRSKPGAAAELERLPPVAAAAEGLWLGLRMLEGIDLGVWLRRAAVDEAWVRTRVAPQAARGNLQWIERPEGPVLRVAPGRWLWHDEIGTALLAP